MDRFIRLDIILPVKGRKLFPQCISDVKLHLSAVAYLDVDTVMLFDKIFSLNLLLLCRQEEQASTHFQAKGPVCAAKISFHLKRKSCSTWFAIQLFA